MSFNINTFKANIANNGVLHTNKYEVYVTLPPILSNLTINTENNSGVENVNTNDMSKLLLMRSNYVTIPSVSLTNLEVNRYGYGIAQKMPYNALINIMNISFICDKKSSIWQLWYMWLKSIVNFAGIDSGSGSIFNSSGNYNIEYKDNYATVISVVFYDMFGNQTMIKNYNQAFPFGMNDVPLTWDIENELLKLTIAITFTDYTISGSTLGGTNNN